MKMTIFLLTVSFLHASAGTWAQNVTLSAKNAPIETVFKSIKDQTGYLFFYKTDLIEKARKVNVQLKNVPLKEALDACFKYQPFVYTIEGKIIIIKPLPANTAPALIAQAVEPEVADREIRGRLSNSKGEPIAGASIQVKNSTSGTTSDAEGQFILRVNDNDRLVISSVGYKSVEIQLKEQTNLSITLEEVINESAEVVVTALGIERKTKALGYSATKIGGDDLTQSRTINLGNALSGKVAGVSVSAMASGPAGSSRVIIRGNTSITDNNQPLYIIDGIPIDNTALGSAGRFGGKDWGDGLSSINPDDIESLTVLKGSNASALYGSRASNGVILITTKKGKFNQGLGVEYNSNFVFDQVIDNYEFQQEYGHGRLNKKPETAAEGKQYGNSSWGGPLDGSMVYRYDGELRPYAYTGSKIKQFYQPGSTFSNTVSFSGGDANKNFRVSLADMNNKSIIPNSGVNRKNFSVNTNGKFKKLTLSTNVQYSIEKVRNRPNLSDAPNNLNYAVAILPGSIDINDLKGTTDKIGANEEGNEFQFSNNSFIQNPYWTAYQNESKDQRDRIIASGKIRYDFTDWLYIDGQAGTDWYTSRRRDLIPFGTTSLVRGSLSELEIRQRETNVQLIIGANKIFGDFGVSAMVGGNRMRRSYETTGNSGEDFVVPYFHSLTNLRTVTPVFSQSETGINSVFGSAELSFRNYLYLTATARNDWFSTLDKGNNQVLYPSAGLSFVFSDAFKLPEWISFGKIRGSWAQVGGGGDIPYRTNLTYNLSAQGFMGAALGGIAQTQVPNTRLQPLLLTEFEYGLDLRLFKNRLGIDVSWYSRKTENDILDAQISNATGFTGATLNIGEMTNKGIELLLTGTPIRKGSFRWDISFNYAHNRNKVVNLGEGITSLTTEQSRSGRAWIQHRVGEAYSSIAGYRQLVIKGQKAYDADGFPVRDENVVLLGKGVAPVSGGVTNEFFYNGFNLSFLVDYRKGGSIYSGTNAIMYSTGVHKNSVEGRETPMVVTGVDADGAALTVNVDPLTMEDWYWMYGTFISENVIYSGDYVKLREFSLGYSLPKRIIQKTPFQNVNLSFVARNLLLLYSGIDNIDPESAFNNTNSQGLEQAGVPNMRSIGLNLRMKF
ncbi:MAG: SusC/RagA family TonB-linked outer membrane protein [Chitinophagaceae bacterium]|nr:SusC/RagA family TonB-linked outer membrane protein [Chitinophagaceae bacterium]